MEGQCRVLLIESEDISMEVFKKYISQQFPHIEVDSAPTPAATMELLKRVSYDIVICDAFLRHEEKISFIGEMCRERGIFLIIITDDTDIIAETFSPYVAESCIHHVLHKPVDLKELSLSIRCAIQRVGARKAETK
jgi:DNA-binding response OmpR family regulator